MAAEIYGSLSSQKGMSLLEGLIAIVIFSIGMLGLMKLQVEYMRESSDAKHRAQAAYLADQLIGKIYSGNSANLSAYAHRVNGGGCAPSGTNSSSPVITSWLNDVNSTLPGAASSTQQIKVNVVDNQVDITVCWRQQDGTVHQHNVTTVIQWQ